MSLRHQLIDVLAVIEGISRDHDRAVAWLQEPIATFGGKTALELVAEGRTEDLLGSWPRSNLAMSAESAAHDEHVTSVAR
ncbi:DUF2384 domain-containing protein [Dyella marensis]|jgi:hypothetical protein|uniref:antitoxin Xre/MbcA/ParS toxin-binding domain-containing protein n=1 Tax=Dyella marensis TaxID=500610 RepID=UPI0014223D08